MFSRNKQIIRFTFIIQYVDVILLCIIQFFFRGESESECEKVRKKRIPAHMKITMVTAVHGPNTNCSYILCESSRITQIHLDMWRMGKKEIHNFATVAFFAFFLLFLFFMFSYSSVFHFPFFTSSYSSSFYDDYIFDLHSVLDGLFLLCILFYYALWIFESNFCLNQKVSRFELSQTG